MGVEKKNWKVGLEEVYVRILFSRVDEKLVSNKVDGPLPI